MSAARDAVAGAPTAVAGREAPESVRTLQNYVGGRWIASDATRFGDIHNPATGELSRACRSAPRATSTARAQAALEAYPAWRQTPPVQRVKPLFRLQAS